MYLSNGTLAETKHVRGDYNAYVLPRSGLVQTITLLTLRYPYDGIILRRDVSSVIFCTKPDRDKLISPCEHTCNLLVVTETEILSVVKNDGAGRDPQMRAEN